jgi:uroporphyrinogen decarboxylase
MDYSLPSSEPLNLDQSHISSGSLILDALKGNNTQRPGIWLMRQAGRYLPEYKELRAKASSFIEFCLNPEMAAQATLQPIKRFGMDGAILFSDILIIPHVLSQDVRFEAGEGPILGPLPDLNQLRSQLETIEDRLAPVSRTLELINREIGSDGAALIGFCGGPWTVMTYMLNGKKAHDRSLIRDFIYKDPDHVMVLLDIITEATIRSLSLQSRSGAKILKIFESWAEGMPDPWFDKLITLPHQKIIKALRDQGITAPIIGFPRGSEARLLHYCGVVKPDGLALGTATPFCLGQELQKRIPIQGSLDPVALRAGGKALIQACDDLKTAYSAGPWVFNLGHGIFPDTPISHVETLLAELRN